MLKKSLGVLITVGCCICLCSCDTPYKEGYLSKLDNAFAKNVLQVDIGDKDPAKRYSYISNALYDRYKNYTLVYFYRGGERQSMEFSKTLTKYAKESWVKLESYSLNKIQIKELAYSSEVDVKSDDYKDFLKHGIKRFFGEKSLTNTDLIKTPMLFLVVGGNVGKISKITNQQILHNELVSKMNEIAEGLWETLYDGPKAKRSFAVRRYPT